MITHYARLHEDTVVALITIDTDAGYSLEGLFPADFVNCCVACPADVEQNWTYASGVFTPPPLILEKARAAKLLAIDAETAAAIIAGFHATVRDQSLRFSYDTVDQQNFADTANAATLALMGVPGVPASVTWNGWKQGDESKTLVRLTLTASEFLNLYMAGALAHKAACMEQGGRRKAALAAASTPTEVDAT